MRLLLALALVLNPESGIPLDQQHSCDVGLLGFNYYYSCSN